MGNGFSADRLARIGRHIDRYVEEGKFPGAMCLVSPGR